MKPERLIVTTSVGNRTKTELWDTSAPIGIGYPFKWVLENTPNGVRIRDLGGAVNQVRKDSGIKISGEAINKGQSFTLPAPSVGGKKVVLSIRHAHAPKPAYSSRELPLRARSAAPYLMVFEGLRRSLVNSQRVHSAYVAYAKGRPVFTVYHGPDGFRVKPLLNGVHLKLKGEHAQQGHPGEFWDLNREQLTRATLVRGWYWWRFNLVEPPAYLSETDEKDAVTVSENRVFKSTLIALGIFLLLALTITWFVAPPPEVKEEPVHPQSVKLLMHRLPAHPKKSVAEPTTVAKPAPEPKPADHEKSEAKKAGENKPKVKPGKKEVKKVETKRPAPVEAKAEKPMPHPAKRPVVAPPRPAPKVETGAEKVAKSRKALLDALGGASSLTKEDVTKEVSAGSPNAGQLFDKAGVAFSPTEVHAGRVARSGNVVGAGGGGGGSLSHGEGGGSAIGYGTGDTGLVPGRGGGFVSLGGAGGEVEEGLTMEEVGAVIHRHMSEVRYCHEAAMLADPKVEGKLTLKFVINAGGVVESTAVGSSNLTNHSLESCIMRRLVTWRFPHPKGGVKVHVSYPFVFKMLGGV